MSAQRNSSNPESIHSFVQSISYTLAADPQRESWKANTQRIPYGNPAQPTLLVLVSSTMAELPEALSGSLGAGKGLRA